MRPIYALYIGCFDDLFGGWESFISTLPFALVDLGAD